MPHDLCCLTVFSISFLRRTMPFLMLISVRSEIKNSFEKVDMLKLFNSNLKTTENYLASFEKKERAF
jgi:hypothetical protein